MSVLFIYTLFYLRFLFLIHEHPHPIIPPRQNNVQKKQFPYNGDNYLTILGIIAIASHSDILIDVLDL